MLPPNLSKADLHLLHVFTAVVDARGFSAAQIELNVSPSTISRQISDLEIRLGMKLCQRGRSGFRVTEKGELVYRAAQRLFASIREFTETVDGSRGKLVGNLSIAVIDNWVFNTQSQFSSALRQFVQQAPDVTIELYSHAPDDMELAVQDGRVSLGIGVFHKHKAGLIYETIGFEKMGLYCAQGHPIFTVNDIAKHEELLKSCQYAKRAYLRERDVSPISRQLNSTALAHQIEGIAHLILTGRYVGYLPEQFANVWVRDGTLRTVAGGKFDQPSELKLVKKKGTDLNLVARTFENLVREHSNG
ncbi:HTH-type transcriptional regulator BenM [Roseovarius albus]|uniref:HTH-type transcriptional regulator BenM n=1 Tax=Roseovarius albus TaxID=1247867 RepID=A0A1X6Y6S0_9RHOB|nr:LysR family transcriptional regulator [Roseovarius albus]SLN12371.1 HTH-type transcriptional regulator BenM [Roseovarius albus]